MLRYLLPTTNKSLNDLNYLVKECRKLGPVRPDIDARKWGCEQQTIGAVIDCYVTSRNIYSLPPNVVESLRTWKVRKSVYLDCLHLCVSL